MCVDVPSFGLLMRDTCDAEGGAVPTAGLIHPRVEGEIAYVMARDLSGPDVSIDQVHAATDFIPPPIEIPASRFAKYRFGLPRVVRVHALRRPSVLVGPEPGPG